SADWYYETSPMGGTAVVLGDRIVKSDADVSREFGDAADRALTGHYDPDSQEGRIMTKPSVQVSSAESAAGRHQAITARRIRFFPEAPPGAKVLRAFQHPRSCVAVEEAIELAELPAPSAWPEPIDHLTAVLIPPGAGSEGSKLSEDWMAAPDNCEAVSTIAFGWSAQKIQWRPGRLLVQGSPEAFEGILAAVADFAFYEGELRTLEHEIEGRE